MINLLRNSVKFTLNGVIKLSAEVFFGQSTNCCEVGRHKQLRLVIYDTGLGIKEQDLKNLFKIFSKLNDPLQINKEGTGLGLYITHNLVVQLGGTVLVESKFEQYTKFTVTIPSKCQQSE